MHRSIQRYTVDTVVYSSIQQYTAVYSSVPAGQQQLIRADIRSVEQESSSISGDERGRGVIICTGFSRAREPSRAGAIPARLHCNIVNHLQPLCNL